MKGNQYLIILLLIAGLFSACKKDNIEHENAFDKSYKSWMSFKSSSNNSYRYKVITSSWTGFSSETTITIKNGKALQRSYVSKSVVVINAQPNIAIRETWDEAADSLNTHPNGATPVTLDEIYQQAKTEWLLKRDKAKTYFEAANNGMISSCGYVTDGCQDDCFRGISIVLIEKL